ncbi:MAG: AraC family transcriptional regulator [Clostridia bacterium]|nr:AraC family transcriptional regulator [Clostridia bacterium]
MKPNYTAHRLVNFININKIVTVHHDELSKNFCFDGERHNFWEMVYIDKGKVQICADSRKFTLKQGQIIFHKPNEFHSISTDAENTADVFVITFMSSSPAMNFFKNKTVTLPEKLKTKMLSLIQESLDTFESLNTPCVEIKSKEQIPIGGQQMIRIHLEELLILLIREENANKNNSFFPTKESMENHLVENMVKTIDENVYKHITVNELCESMNYSRAYLAKIFKSSVSMSIGEYITHSKIREAKKLIRQNKYSFVQISDMLQFDNQHYFSRVFKKVTNFTPTQYKNSVL